MSKPAPVVGQVWMEIGRDVLIVEVLKDHVKVRTLSSEGKRNTKMKITTLHSKFDLCLRTLLAEDL